MDGRRGPAGATLKVEGARARGRTSPWQAASTSRVPRLAGYVHAGRTGGLEGAPCARATGSSSGPTTAGPAAARCPRRCAPPRRAPLADPRRSRPAGPPVHRAGVSALHRGVEALSHLGPHGLRLIGRRSRCMRGRTTSSATRARDPPTSSTTSPGRRDPGAWAASSRCDGHGESDRRRLREDRARSSPRTSACSGRSVRWRRCLRRGRRRRGPAIARDEQARPRRARSSRAGTHGHQLRSRREFGNWQLGDDDVLMPLITTANLACGFHGGDPVTMRETVATAVEHGVAVGAHPGLPDLLGFGRREMDVSPEDRGPTSSTRLARWRLPRALGARSSITSSRTARCTRCSTGTRPSPRPSSMRCTR